MLLAALLVAVTRVIRDRTGPESMERRILAALGSTGDSIYRVRVGSSRLSVLGGTYVATGIEILPDSMAVRDRREAGAPLRDRFALRVASLRVTGLDVWGLYRGRLKAGTAVVDSLVLETYLDRTVPGRLDPLRRLPHEFFRTIPAPVRIDTIRLETSEFRYSEKAIDGARPGTIRFANSRIGVYNLTNDTLRPHRPVIIDLHTLLAGLAPSDAVFEYDFRSPKLNLDFQGSVRDLDASRLNGLTVDLEGMRLTGGHLDSAGFKFQVKDNVGNGEMTLLYRGLKAEFLDKVSRKGGLSDWLKTLIANKFVLRENNGPEGDNPTRTRLDSGVRAPSRRAAHQVCMAPLA